MLETSPYILPNLEEDRIEESYTIEITGEPNVTFKETVHGSTGRSDIATIARLVNIIPAVIDARPGLLSVLDLPATTPLPDKQG